HNTLTSLAKHYEDTAEAAHYRAVADDDEAEEVKTEEAQPIVEVEADSDEELQEVMDTSGAASSSSGDAEWWKFIARSHAELGGQTAELLNQAEQQLNEVAEREEQLKQRTQELEARAREAEIGHAAWRVLCQHRQPHKDDPEGVLRLAVAKAAARVLDMAEPLADDGGDEDAGDGAEVQMSSSKRRRLRDQATHAAVRAAEAVGRWMERRQTQPTAKMPTSGAAALRRAQKAKAKARQLVAAAAAAAGVPPPPPLEKARPPLGIGAAPPLAAPPPPLLQPRRSAPRTPTKRPPPPKPKQPTQPPFPPPDFLLRPPPPWRRC
ncbi:MAG: hypothetical protein GY772_08190, partial [bacterium]|nr:hypothetical protein [bacterium]